MEDAMKVYCVLTYNRNPVGVRILINGNTFADIAIDAIKGVTKDKLKKLNVESLIEHGNLLVTKDELTRGYAVIDKSTDTNFCSQIIALLNTPIASTLSKPKPQQKDEPKVELRAEPKAEPLKEVPEIQEITSAELANLSPTESQYFKTLNCLTTEILSRVGNYLSHLSYMGFNFDPKHRRFYSNKGTYSTKFKVQIAKGSIPQTRYPASYVLTTAVTLKENNNDLDFIISIRNKEILRFMAPSYKTIQSSNADIAFIWETIAHIIALFLDRLYKDGTDEWEKAENNIALKVGETLIKLRQEHHKQGKSMSTLIIDNVLGHLA